MKYLWTIVLLSCISQAFPQSHVSTSTKSRKGEFYLYWGWNWGWYGKSNLRFTGADYDFTLQQVRAQDRQSEFNAKTYFSPSTLTIPQYNVRLGYFMSDKYSLTVGTDHMKYVVQAGQSVQISGQIENSGTRYDGNYLDEAIVVQEGFLQFEHTDGLNYANVELRRTDPVVTMGKLDLGLTTGAGAGIMLPKTNATLLGNDRYDEFHLAGFGLSAVTAVQLTFWDRIFVQSEFKGGVIHMPDIRTTQFRSDKGHQSFLFSQLNIVFGGIFRLNNKER